MRTRSLPSGWTCTPSHTERHDAGSPPLKHGRPGHQHPRFDGEVAFQAVFNFHLNVIPRYAGDGLGEPFGVEPQERGKSLPDGAAQAIRSVLSSTGK